jgi:hypothetical protein
MTNAWDLYESGSDPLYDEILLYITDEANARSLIPDLKSCAEIEQQWLGRMIALEIRLQVPIVSGYDKLVGCWDAVISTTSSSYRILIVPHIKHVGKTLRTLHVYREFDRANGAICIISTDEQYRKLFESAGIKFYTYTRKENEER